MSNPLREYLKKLREEASGSAGQAREAEDLYYETEGGYGTTGGPLDAFRHSYATGANVMDYGLRGLIAPMAHEFEALIDPKKKSCICKRHQSRKTSKLYT
jgi:hypothetical protein